MGGACSTYEGRRGYTGFWRGNLRDKDHLKEPDVGGSIILILRKWDGRMEWIDLAQDKDSWWGAFPNAVINFRVPSNAGNFLTN
jgi:hypothetical protein